MIYDMTMSYGVIANAADVYIGMYITLYADIIPVKTAKFTPKS